MKQFFRFLTVGVFNTLLGYCVIFACMYLVKMTPETSNAAGYAVGLFVSYVLHRNFTFNSKQRKRDEIASFLIVFLVAYATNFVALLVFIHKLGFNEGLSQLLAGVVYVAASFIMNKYYVFKTIRGDLPKPRSDLTLLRLQMLKEFDCDAVDQLIYGVKAYTALQHLNLVADTKNIQTNPALDDADKDWLERLHEEDHYFLEEAEKLSTELAIVALYKKIEITTKSTVFIAYPDIPSKDLFQIKKMKKALKAKNIDINQLSHYASMDEIRCLNNVIKHGGLVDGELARYPIWKKGTSLSDLHGAYQRLAPLCVLYMRELVDILIQQHRNKGG